MRRRLKRFTEIVALSCLILSFTACALLPAEEVRRTAPIVKLTQAEEFELAYVTRGDMSLTRRVSCTYVPIQRVPLYFGVSGEYIDEVFVSVGDQVKKGDLLAQLRMSGVEESIADCRAEILRLNMEKAHLEENRELALKRAKTANDGEALEKAIEEVNTSYDKSAISINDSLSINSLRLDALLEARDLRQIRATIDGTVTYVRKYQESSVSSETERAITIADSTMSLFTAFTDLWEYLPVGTHVTITVKKVEYEAVVADEVALGLPKEERIPGKNSDMYFTLVTPTFDLEDNDKGSTIVELDSRKDVLKIPEAAVSKAGGETIVYYLDLEGMKAYKPVTVGLRADKFYEVISGLSEGEAVILV